jgi:hypothetical protein
MILAGLLYYTPAIYWLKPKTNGLLLKVPVSVAMLELSAVTQTEVTRSEPLKTWQLWYVVGESCDKHCQVDLNQLRNAQKSLGKEQHRVILRTVAPSAALPFLKPGTLAIVDPLDWLMLYYEPGMPYKGMLNDLKRLLKYSHIG